MDPETEGRFDDVEFRLTEAEEKIVSQDVLLSAIREVILRAERFRRPLDRPANGT